MANKFVSSTNLIFDLGMNDGEDTYYYLKKGYRVVAVEANPYLVKQAKLRFEKEIQGGDLIIHNLAIWTGYEKKNFYINTQNDHWSSLNPNWTSRDNTSSFSVDVNCVPVSHLIALYGVPSYIKIDIEGADDVVINQLKEEQYCPKFLSLEDCRFGFDYLETLHNIGYQFFKLSDQSIVDQLVDTDINHQFQRGSSGPLGDDVPGAWLSYDEMVEVYSRVVRDTNNNRHAPRTIWWDIHCRACEDNALNII